MKPEDLSRWHRALRDLIRDAILFFTGIGLIIYSSLTGNTDPALLVLYGGMVGLPMFLRADAARQSDKDSQK